MQLEIIASNRPSQLAICWGGRWDGRPRTHMERNTRATANGSIISLRLSPCTRLVLLFLKITPRVLRPMSRFRSIPLVIQNRRLVVLWGGWRVGRVLMGTRFLTRQRMQKRVWDWPGSAVSATRPRIRGFQPLMLQHQRQCRSENKTKQQESPIRRTKRGAAAIRAFPGTQGSILTAV